MRADRPERDVVCRVARVVQPILAMHVRAVDVVAVLVQTGCVVASGAFAQTMRAQAVEIIVPLQVSLF